MAYLFAGIVILGVLILLGRAFIAADPRALVRMLRYLVGGALLLFGLIFFLAERWGLALPLAAAGISALSLGRIGPIDLGGVPEQGVSDGKGTIYVVMHDAAGSVTVVDASPDALAALCCQSGATGSQRSRPENAPRMSTGGSFARRRISDSAAPVSPGFPIGA